jgi:hypothetical protein
MPLAGWIGPEIPRCPLRRLTANKSLMRLGANIDLATDAPAPGGNPSVADAHSLQKALCAKSSAFRQAAGLQVQAISY